MKIPSEEKRVLNECLSIAVSNGKRDNVLYYLQAGADPDHCFKDAIWRRDMAIIGDFLKFGADVNYVRKDDRSKSPLLVTAMLSDVRAGSTQCVDLLLQHGADPHARFMFSGEVIDINGAMDEYALICDISEFPALAQIREVVERHIMAGTAAAVARHRSKRPANRKYRL